MKTARRAAYWAAGLSVVFCMAFLPGAARSVQEPGVPSGQEQKAVRLIPSLEGRDLFRSYCSTCHGADGAGNGPVAPALNSSVPDLTTIRKRNGGIFPTKRIEQVIAGNELIVAHGSREMPVWGPIFHQVEQDRDFGNVRLRNVTRYLETIQQK